VATTDGEISGDQWRSGESVSGPQSFLEFWNVCMWGKAVGAALRTGGQSEGVPHLDLRAQLWCRTRW